MGFSIIMFLQKIDHNENDMDYFCSTYKLQNVKEFDTFLTRLNNFKPYCLKGKLAETLTSRYSVKESVVDSDNTG